MTVSTVPVLKCTKCDKPLPPSIFNKEETQHCPFCDLDTRVDVFPAFFKPPEKGEAGETVQVDGEASCFYHPDKRAEIACEICGRFLCKLCDIELRDEHMCPSCMEGKKSRDQLNDLENERTLYDEVAVSLAIAPILFWPMTLVTAPAAVFMCIRYWKRPLSVMRRTKIRYVIAMVIALLQIAGWSAFFLALAGVFD